MTTTIRQVQGFLDEHDLTYQVVPEHSIIILGFSLNGEETTYRDEDGDAHLRIVITVAESGDFIAVFAPNAWNIDDCLHKPAVFQALLEIQARFKALRFDYDPADGEVRPNIEVPLEDATLTSQQFHRLLHGVIIGTQRFDPVIRHAMETGEVSFEMLGEESKLTATEDPASLEDLADRAGGLDELERLIGGHEYEADAGS